LNPFVSSHQFISTATVPVIKLVFKGLYFGSDKDFYVDITLNDESKDENFIKGYQTINFVQTSFAQINILRPVCLYLKKLLRENSLDEPYTGGLGSFALFVLTLNVYNVFSTDMTTSTDLLLKFLSFIGSFNPKL